MTTVTLQTIYCMTPPCHVFIYPKVARLLEMSYGSGIYSDVVSHLPAAQHRPVHRVDVVDRDVITRSLDSHDHHYDVPLIFRVKKSLLPVNNRHRENFWAFTGPRRDFGLILLILNMIIHRSFTGPTHLLSANVRGPVSFAVSGIMRLS